MYEKIKTAFYLREGVARGVRILAAREGRTQSDIAEEALEAYLTDRQESLDWTRAAEGAFQFWDNPDDAAYDDL